jgi:15-cis-phytoene synthase
MPMPSPDDARREREDLKACAVMLREGSRSFHAASFVLPRRIREPAQALYAFCRVADDAVDLGADRAQAVRDLQERLALIYAGAPADSPVDRAFARVVSAFAIPRALPDALIDGFAWDAQGRRYETIEEVHAYAARVAGSVGAMMTVVMGKREPEVLARACDLGVAMQLTNIARDIGEDARCGRLYLPQAWLRDEGLCPEAWLADPVFDERIARIGMRLLALAEELYIRAEAGIAALPADCRPGMHAARLLYREIGCEVLRRPPAMLGERAVVPASRKAALLSRAMYAAIIGAERDDAPPLEAVRFMIDAVREQVRPVLHVRDEPARIVWLITLFERLERRDAMERV